MGEKTREEGKRSKKGQSENNRGQTTIKFATHFFNEQHSPSRPPPQRETKGSRRDHRSAWKRKRGQIYSTIGDRPR